MAAGGRLRAVTRKPMEAKKGGSFTHFLAIPFTNELVLSNFAIFKNRILNDVDNCDKANIDESLFQNPKKIHVTFGIMNLTSNEEEEKACSILRTFNHEVLLPIIRDSGPLVVNMRGVSFFGDDPKETHVLFATLKSEERLQKIADDLVDRFAQAGLMDRTDSGVKLHVTLMNSVFRARSLQRQQRYPRHNHGDRFGSRGRHNIKRTPFDSTNILQDFAEFSFSEDLILPGIHLSNARITDKQTGFYAPRFKVDFETEKRDESTDTSK
ncbi:activating signal cointegrator 1 complex subunit 1 [Brevipalpus obovatus]|uniref:activating signal cointegrator 1 complex subunit 1 n=1 Tax=Brevipalpus obovatus TaxID=246614 RepID=UPI003D9E5419